MRSMVEGACGAEAIQYYSNVIRGAPLWAASSRGDLMIPNNHSEVSESGTFDIVDYLAKAYSIVQARSRL
jgi:hypothetical protein